MKITNYSFLHQVGNIIQAFTGIGEDLVTILSLGFISVNWKYQFTKYRLFDAPSLYKQAVKPKSNNTPTDEGWEVKDEIQLGVNGTNDNDLSLSEDKNKIYNKIPIFIHYYDDGDTAGWKAELPDNYENYTPTYLNNINFEDISFHFGVDISTNSSHLFETREDAYESAIYCIKKYLNNNGTIIVEI